jgi:hypothetical protein
MAIKISVIRGPLGTDLSVLTFVRSREHPGQRIPTGVGVMQ